MVTPFCLRAQAIPHYQGEVAADQGQYIIADEFPTELLPGCSWYCGGDVHGFVASSALPTYKGIDYSAERAHDFDISTAWVEGADGQGEGEYLKYSFDYVAHPTHPNDPPADGLGITELILVNGYAKSERLWQLNSRVKNLRIYLNDAPYADVTLVDTAEVQLVPIGTIMFKDHGGQLTLRFEITATYPGTKYADKAISELVFGGVGVH